MCVIVALTRLPLRPHTGPDSCLRRTPEAQAGTSARLRRGTAEAGGCARGLRQPCRQAIGGVVLRYVVDVDHGSGDVGVAHVCLDVGERELLDGESAEGVAQVVEAQVLD